MKPIHFGLSLIVTLLMSSTAQASTMIDCGDGNQLHEGYCLPNSVGCQRAFDDLSQCMDNMINRFKGSFDREKLGAVMEAGLEMNCFPFINTFKPTCEKTDEDVITILQIKVSELK